MELDNVTATIAKIPFFDICDTEQQRLLAFSSERRTFKAGQTIYTEADPGDGAYILTRGSVVIGDERKRADRTYGVSGPNVMVGELCLVLDRPRRTGVTAVTNVEAVFVPRMAFVKLMRQFPEMAARAAERIEEELSSYLAAVSRFRPQAGDEQYK